MNYSIFYRRCIAESRISKELPEFDVFVSAFNPTERILSVSAAVRAKRKVWLIHPEYHLDPLALPNDHPRVQPLKCDEVTQVEALLAQLGDLSGLTLCIDITGFMRHVLIFLIAKLERIGVVAIEALYSEPVSYMKDENTEFSTRSSGVVRPVRGMGGSIDSRARDALVLGVGYDHKLISEVAASKDNATIYPLFAFPSLSPEMYQQSAIRSQHCGEVALEGSWVTNRRFAPANDPFATAGVLHEIVRSIDSRKAECNIYLSPLSTKAQALGFALYWIFEGRQRGRIAILLPECVSYSQETSIGLKRLWSFTVELR